MLHLQTSNQSPSSCHFGMSAIARLRREVGAANLSPARPHFNRPGGHSASERSRRERDPDRHPPPAPLPVEAAEAPGDPGAAMPARTGGREVVAQDLVPLAGEERRR